MKKYYRPLTILLLFLAGLFSEAAHAQANFHPGYVVPLVGDTLRGEIDSREASTNAQRCRFRATPEAAVSTYTPAEIRGYGLLGDKHYRALTVPATDDKLPVGTPVGAVFFMEVLVDGPAQLYFLRAQGYDYYLVASPSMPLTLLLHSIGKVERKVNGSMVTFQEELRPYRPKLAQALANCPVAQSKLPTLPYTEAAFRQVVALYNYCQNGRPVQASSRPPAVHARLGLAVGITQSRLSFDAGGQFNNQSIPYAVAAAGGITLSLTVPRLSQERITLQTAVLYGVQKHDSEYTVSAPGTLTGTQSTRLHLNLAYLRVPILLRYVYPRGRVRPLLEAGFITGISIRSENYYQTTNYFGEYGEEHPLIPRTNFGLFEYGIGGGGGLATVMPGGRTAALLARAEISYGFANALGISTAVYRFSALLSVDLTK